MGSIINLCPAPSKHSFVKSRPSDLDAIAEDAAAIGRDFTFILTHEKDPQPTRH